VVALYVTAPATAVALPLVSLILVLVTVVALAASENVIAMAVLVATWVAPDAGEEDATVNVAEGVVVTGLILTPDAHPVISATMKVSEIKDKLQDKLGRIGTPPSAQLRWPGD